MFRGPWYRRPRVKPSSENKRSFGQDPTMTDVRFLREQAWQREVLCLVLSVKTPIIIGMYTSPKITLPRTVFLTSSVGVSSWVCVCIPATECVASLGRGGFPGTHLQMLLLSAWAIHKRVYDQSVEEDQYFRSEAREVYSRKQPYL